jgi:hypothetical protein
VEGRQQPRKHAAAGSQACRRFAGMRRGAALAVGPNGRQASGCGRQASIRLICRQTEAGRLCAQTRHAVSQVTEGGAAWQAGRWVGSRLEYRRVEGRHAGLRQTSARWQAVKKTIFFFSKSLDICEKGVIPANLNCHFCTVTIYHEVRF